VACNDSERNAFLAGDMMEQLALVLREVVLVGLEECPPKPSIQLVELFGVRLVRHGVQYISSPRRVW